MATVIPSRSLLNTIWQPRRLFWPTFPFVDTWRNLSTSSSLLGGSLSNHSLAMLTAHQIHTQWKVTVSSREEKPYTSTSASVGPTALSLAHFSKGNASGAEPGGVSFEEEVGGILTQA